MRHKTFVRNNQLAFDNISPNKKIQRAITPELLRHLACVATLTVLNIQVDHAIDHIIRSYFFAIRSCKCTKTTSLGRTKMINLWGVCFYTADHTEVSHKDSYLIQKSTYVWVLFKDQKNGMKFDSRLHKKTGDHLLCPVLQFGRAAQQVRKLVPGADDSTPLCIFKCTAKRKVYITQTYIRDLLRKTCKRHGGPRNLGLVLRTLVQNH